VRPGGFLPGVITDLAAAGALLGPNKSGVMSAFHPVTIGSGGSVALGLTERVISDPTARSDTRLRRSGTSFFGDATSPMVVRYRALGIVTSQTLTLTSPTLVLMPCRSCR
jgi:hypothetical protein